MLDIIFVHLNLLRLVLWPRMWSVLESVPCAVEKTVYFAGFGCKFLWISVNFKGSNVSFKTTVSLLIFLSG